jgi:hypothetical protein
MTKIEQVWKAALQKSDEFPIDGTGYRLNRIDSDSPLDIYAGIDAACSVMIAIGLTCRPPSVDMEASAFDYFRHQRLDGSWLMVLRLKRHGLEAVFGRLCQDLLDAADNVNGEMALAALFRERLLLWKRLFEHGANGLLEANQIKGLMAELLTLESLIVRFHRDLGEAVNGWVGPLGADQDFVFSDTVLEVKAIRPGANEISISSLDQLSSPLPIKLVIFSMRSAVPGEHDAFSLNEVVARLESLISSDPGALLTFKDRLLEAGFVEQNYYDTICFEHIENKWYAVDVGFPRLTTQSVAEGITRVEYTISADVIKDFEWIEAS